MRRSIVVVVLLLAMPLMVTGEQCGQMKCPKCTDQPNPTDCTSGCLTKDRCGCCLVCAKAKDEPCRGPNDYYGYCADGLYCNRSSNIAIGKCKECMPACTIDYCGGRDKLCSATGYVHHSQMCDSKITTTVCSSYGVKSASSKDAHQHITCGSCSFVSDPVPQCTKCNHRNQTKGESKCHCKVSRSNQFIVGEADRLPLGGAGGMLMDPFHQGRTPCVPQGTPPGAQFDPFSPIHPTWTPIHVVDQTKIIHFLL